MVLALLTSLLIGQSPPTIDDLVKALRAPEPITMEFRFVGCSVFHDREEPTDERTAELLQILKNDRLPTPNRVAALSLIACRSPAMPSTRNSVDAAVKGSKALSNDQEVWFLQRSLGTHYGIALSLARIAKHPEELSLAVGGQSARHAEPSVLRVLDDEHADIRIEAIRVLGALGGEASVPRLVELLSDQRDWRAPCAAARSLAQLKASGQQRDLEAAARAAWFPPTKRCIEGAREALEKGTALEPERGFVSQKQLAPTPLAGRGPDELDARALERLSVTRAVRTITNHGRFTPYVTDAPKYGLVIDAGILAGTANGEWGGALVLLPPDAGQQILLAENVWGIHRLGTQIVVVSGLRHMRYDAGAVHRIAPNAKGVLTAYEWRILPGAPERSVVLPNGRLFVSCSGADIVIDEAGKISLATQTNIQ